MEDTIFGKITRGEIPTEFLYEDDHCVVIRDIHPQAPTHVLIIPRKPIPRLVDSSADDQALLGHLLLVASRVAEDLGVGDVPARLNGASPRTREDDHAVDDDVKDGDAVLRVLPQDGLEDHRIPRGIAE